MRRTITHVFDRFYEVLEATTVPISSGARRVDGVAHAVGLSEATDDLHDALVGLQKALWERHGRPVVGYPLGMRLEESDSPDGPWTAIPASDVRSRVVPIGGTGADALLMAAITSATRVTRFPAAKWNAMQARRPGAQHQRWHAGDEVSPSDLNTLKSARQLLRLAGPAIEAVGPVESEFRYSIVDVHLHGEPQPALSPPALAEAVVPRPSRGPHEEAGHEDHEPHISAVGTAQDSSVSTEPFPEASGPSPQSADLALLGGVTPHAFLSEADLAKRFQVNQDTLRRRLRAWRPDHLNNDWIEVPHPRPNDPRFLYRVRSVLPILSELSKTGQ